MSKKSKASSGKGDSIGPAEGGNIFFVDETVKHCGDRDLATPHGSNFAVEVHTSSESMDRVGKSKNGG